MRKPPPRRPNYPNLARKRFTTGGGGMRFNPKAKLDPSQVQDLRWLGGLERAVKTMEGKRQQALNPPSGKELFPFLTMQQRMRILQNFARYRPDIKRPPLIAGSFDTWLQQMLAERRTNRPRSIT